MAWRAAIIALLVGLALTPLGGCSSSSGGSTAQVPTNGTPVMVELYTDW